VDSNPPKIIKKKTKVESLVAKLKAQGYKPCLKGCKTKSGHPFLVKDADCPRCKKQQKEAQPQDTRIRTNYGDVVITSKHPHVQRMLDKGYTPCPNGCKAPKSKTSPFLVKNKCKLCSWVNPQLQADSKYPNLPLNKDGSCITPLYHQNGHASTKIFGTLAKIKRDDGTFWIITDHQFIDGVYVKNNNKIIDLKKLDGWRKEGEGNFAYHLLPASKLQIDNIEPKKSWCNCT
jgi:hypothetical protein